MIQAGLAKIEKHHWNKLLKKPRKRKILKRPERERHVLVKGTTKTL